MKKKILMSLGAIALVASSLYASGAKSCEGDREDKGMKCKSNKDRCEMKHKHHAKKHHVKSAHKLQHRPIAAIMQLNLTTQQRSAIKDIIKANKNNASKISTAFSKDSFDKELYIKNKQQRQEMRIQREAELVAKIYATLTAEQKQTLQTKLSN